MYACLALMMILQIVEELVTLSLVLHILVIEGPRSRQEDTPNFRVYMEVLITNEKPTLLTEISRCMKLKQVLID